MDQTQSASDRTGIVLKAGPFEAGILHAEIAPHQGGRIGALWLETSGGKRIDALEPMDGAAFDPLVWPKAGSYPLAPWSNLIKDGQFACNGQTVTLMPHPQVAPHALHGFTQMRVWQVEEQTSDRLIIAYNHQPSGQDLWPWPFIVRQTMQLDSGGLHVTIALENRSASPMPAGLGQHPYFKLALGDRVQFDVRRQWQPDDRFVTHARVLTAEESSKDIRHEALTQTLHFDGFGGDLRITRADGFSVRMTSSPEFGHLVFHVPQGGAYACIEPVTHVVDAFNLETQGITETGFRLLAPNETLAGHMTISLRKT